MLKVHMVNTLRTQYTGLGLYVTDVISQSLPVVYCLTLGLCLELSWLWEPHSDLF